MYHWATYVYISCVHQGNVVAKPVDLSRVSHSVEFEYTRLVRLINMTLDASVEDFTGFGTTRRVT